MWTEQITLVVNPSTGTSTHGQVRWITGGYAINCVFFLVRSPVRLDVYRIW